MDSLRGAGTVNGPWNEQDEQNGTREKLARVIASIASGDHPVFVVPDAEDYALADQFRWYIEMYYTNLSDD